MSKPHVTGRPGKIPVSARVSSTIAKELDRLAEAIRPKPTRSQMVAMALEDWVKTQGMRHGKERE